MENNQHRDKPARPQFIADRRDAPDDKPQRTSAVPLTNEEQIIKLLRSIDGKLTFIVAVIALGLLLTMCNPNF